MMNQEFLHRSWVEIDLKQLEQNYLYYKSAVSDKSEIMVVVKANAYGHGDNEVVKKLLELGVKLFAVSNIEEAIKLRNIGVDGEILILGYTPVSSAKELSEYGITQALLDENYASQLSASKYAKTIKVQFAIDTGMNRIGLDADDPSKCISCIYDYSNKFILNGIFTHLCVADSDAPDKINYTNEQLSKFDRIKNGIESLNLPYIHCFNSAGGLFYSDKWENLSSIIRLGIILYGLKPDISNTLPKGIKPILLWKSVVSMVKTVHKGEKIGYGCGYEANREIKVATIPTGYADGYNRLLSNQWYVLINGVKANIVGRICMDQMMVDVTDIDNVNMGTEVVLIGNSGSLSIGVDDMADSIGTIGYELVCDITKRVPRICK